MDEAPVTAANDGSQTAPPPPEPAMPPANPPAPANDPVPSHAERAAALIADLNHAKEHNAPITNAMMAELRALLG